MTYDEWERVLSQMNEIVEFTMKEGDDEITLTLPAEGMSLSNLTYICENLGLDVAQLLRQQLLVFAKRAAKSELMKPRLAETISQLGADKVRQQLASVGLSGKALEEALSRLTKQRQRRR